jgi:hypothetical protein
MIYINAFKSLRRPRTSFPRSTTIGFNPINTKQQIILQVQLLQQVLLEHLLHFLYSGIFIFLDLLFLNKIYICFDVELNCFWRINRAF